MALIACWECKSQISKTAVACPQCGAKQRKADGNPIGKFLVVLFVGYIVFSCTTRFNSSDTPAKKAETAISPEQAAANAMAERDRKSRDDLAFDIGKAVRKAARNPESVVFEAVLVNQKGTEACAQYRAQNGFGGMSRESIVVVGSQIKTATTELLKKHCAGQMFDHAVMAGG